MADYPSTIMTKLDAVNLCLSAMGQPPVSSLESPAPDAQIAIGIVDEVSRTTQAKGWHWNTEVHTLQPNVDGEILLPWNTLRVDTINGSKSVDVVARGLKLFKRSDNTYTFTEPLTVEIFVLLDYELLPFACKDYIAFSAARKMQQRSLGSETLNKFEVPDEKAAYALLLQEEADVSDANMLYDNWSTSAILTRGYFSRGSMG